MPKSKTFDVHKTKSTCRVCLSVTSKLIGLFEPFKNFTASYYINNITDIEISETDALPRSICKLCIKQLDNVLKFKEKCEKSDKYLHSHLEREVIDSKSAIKCEDRNIFSVKEEKLDIEFVDQSISSTLKNELNQNEPVKEETSHGVDHIPEDSHHDHSGIDTDTEIKEIKQKKKTSKKSVKRKKEFSFTDLNCADCGKTFENESKRKMHWYNVHRNKSYVCEICQNRFKSALSFEKHKNLKVSCKDRFNGVRVERIGKTKVYHCTSCEYKSNTLDGVRKHSVRHTGARPHSCNLCPKTYTSSKSLSYHKETVHKVYSAQITCHMCGKIIEGRHRFNRHFRFTHPNNQYQCDICKAFMKSKWGLVNHIKTHDNLKEYVCDSCGRTFNTSFNLRNHIRRLHEKGMHIEADTRRFNCHLCAYKSKGILYLKKHLEHHYQAKWQCTVCYRFSDSPLKLIKHMRVHGEKKVFCLYCNKGFALKKQCTEHEKRKHHGKTLLPCMQKPLSPTSDHMDVCG